MQRIPEQLHGRPFTRAEANSAGLSDRVLSGRRFVRIHPGVYRTSSTAPSLGLRIDAALLKAPSGSAVSHLTNLSLRGMPHGSDGPVHLATWSAHEVDLDNVVVHRYLHPIDIEIIDGRPMTMPMRTAIDCATLLDDLQLLQVADAMARAGLLREAVLQEHCRTSHLDGVRRARRVAALVDGRSASPQESAVRWHLARAGLPRPEMNVDIHDRHGAWLACGDLVFREQQVLVEYDGWQHERDARQRQWDHLRREALEAAGWRVIVITAEDMKRPILIARRVEQALRQRGFRG